jgi:hypothetical protein
MMETIYKRFSTCSRRASTKSHAHCTGSYRGYQPGYGYNSKDAESHEVVYRCDCPGHDTGLCGSIQRDFFKPQTSSAPPPAEPKQGKLF